MNTPLSRRNFLKLSATTLAAMAFPYFKPPYELRPHPIGRVTLEMIRYYGYPYSDSVRKGWLYRDQVLELLEEVDSDDPNMRNPRWYRIACGHDEGYVHSAYIQRVRETYNHPVAKLPSEHVLGEITVPFVQSFRREGAEWQKLYRLYYGSLHWITGIDQIEGQTAYRIFDYDVNVEYFVDATAVRLLNPAHYAPSAQNISRDEKHIVVSIRKQTLTAYQGPYLVMMSSVSTGQSTRQKEGAIPTETPIGDFRIRKKCPTAHMGNGNLTSEILAYELPGVPWVMYFDPNGVALHGCYWHDNFGSRMSHGCVNLPNDVAQWLYRWTDPVCGDDWFTTGEGTHIRVEV